MNRRSKHALVLLVALATTGAMGVVASGCELAVRLNVPLPEGDSGPAPCPLCLDGTVEPDGNIEYGPAVDAPLTPRSD
jgi:hypothetical protein